MASRRVSKGAFSGASFTEHFEAVLAELVPNVGEEIRQELLEEEFPQHVGELILKLLAELLLKTKIITFLLGELLSSFFEELVSGLCKKYLLVPLFPMLNEFCSYEDDDTHS